MDRPKIFDGSDQALLATYVRIIVSKFLHIVDEMGAKTI